MSEEQKPADAQTFRGANFELRQLQAPAPPLTLPRADQAADADGIDQRFAAQRAAARTHSIAELATWFPGYDFDLAAQTTDDRRFTLLDIGSALFEHLNALDTVERMFAEHDNIGAQIRFSGGPKGQPDPHRVFEPERPAARRLRVGGLVNALSKQWTAVLNNLDLHDPAVATVCEHLERVYGARVNTNVYVSFGLAEGFGPHWDSHDTIIVPAAGTKKWTVYEPAVLSPQRPWVGDTVSSRPVWEGEISPGMCLIIPRGWGHVVGGSDDLAIHYTIGVNRISVNNIVERLVVDSGYNPVVRADVAYEPTGDVSSYEQSVHDEPDILSNLVAELATPELIDRSIATYRARMPLRLFPRLFDMWTAAGLDEWSGATVRMPLPAGVQIAASADHVALAFANSLVHADADATELLIALADTQPHQLADLPLADDPALQTQILKDLALAGLIDVSFTTGGAD